MPCATRACRRVDGQSAVLLEREGCGASELGPSGCDYWREAVDGFVLGVSGGILHARHRSVGHGDASCVDVLYVRPESPLRYGPIPAEMKPVLDRVTRQARAFNSRQRIEFVGLSEGVLYYRCTSPAGSGEVSTNTMVERAARARFPNLKVQEISPRPVIAGDS